MFSPRNKTNVNFGHGVVGCGKDVLYLTSLGRPTDIGLQLGKTSLLQVRVEGECFYFSIPVPLSPLPLSFISSTISSIPFLPFSGRQQKMTPNQYNTILGK